MSITKFKDKKAQIEITQFGPRWFDLYHKDKLISSFSTLKAAKKYYTKEFKNVKRKNNKTRKRKPGKDSR